MIKLLVTVVIIISAVFIMFYFQNKCWIEEIHLNVPPETSSHLDNPDRGGYYIYDFLITDEQKDYQAIIESWFGRFSETRLALLEINLAEYAGGDISNEGIKNIENILRYSSQTNKHLILRFLYDRGGKASLSEPKNIQIIARHMEQLQPLLEDYKKNIFCLQGLFIGDWGEMHGGQYKTYPEMRYLAEKLAKLTPKDMFLSLRTPAQWRNITGYEGNITDVSKNEYASRFGIFNDGMLGNEYDTGTYGSFPSEKAGYLHPWIRSEEIAFQNTLCRYVPNGGEVIIENSYNDINNAIKDMKATHVTYLNLDYDPKVWNKWANSIVEEDSVFGGIDGKTYMIEHFGYRYVLRNVSASINRMTGSCELKINIENVGFAPSYNEIQVKIGLTGNSHSYSYDFGTLSNLEDQYTIKEMIPVKQIEKDDYVLDISLIDDEGNLILFGNESDTDRLIIGDIKAKW